jgi:hypothetical protein
MQRKLNWLMVSALAIGGVTFVTAQAADDNKAATPAAEQNLGQPGTVTVDANANRTDDAQRAAAHAAGSLALPAGAKNKSDSDIKATDFTSVLANVTEEAMDKGNFNDVIGFLVDQDRNRLGDGKSLDLAKLDGRIDALRQAFKSKYGEDSFDVHHEKLFTTARVVEGEIQDPNQFAQNWPVAQTGGSDALKAGASEGLKAVQPGDAKATDANRATASSGDDKSSASVKVGDTSVSGQIKQDDAKPAGSKVIDDETRTQGNIQEGRNIAVLQIPESHGLSAVNVSLLRELTGWKIDIPNNRSVQQVYDDLLKHLTMVGDQQANWPADKDDAKAMIAHHVMMALYGVEASPAQKS